MRKLYAEFFLVITAIAGCDYPLAAPPSRPQPFDERRPEVHPGPSSPAGADTQPVVADSAAPQSDAERCEPTLAATRRQTIADILRKTGAMVHVDAESGQVRSINAGPPDVYPSPRLSEKDFDLIGQCHEIASLKLNKSSISDNDLEKIGSLTNLRHLDISDTAVTDRGFSVVRNFAALDIINVNNTAISDASICILADTAPVRALYAENVGITDRGAECISKLTGLLYLRLSGTKLTNAGLEKLTTLRSVGELKLASTNVDDDGLKHLAHFSALNTLDLSHCKIVGHGLKHVARLPIGWLTLNGTLIGDDVIEHLIMLKEPIAIEVRETRMTADGVRQLMHALPKTSIRHSIPESKLNSDSATSKP